MLLASGATLALTPSEILAHLQAQDRAVEAIGFQLSTSNAPLCPGKGWNAGFSVHTLEQYGAGYREAAAVAFALGKHPAVMSVAPGSPAHAAGLRDRDALAAIDGMPTPLTGKIGAGSSFKRTGVVQNLVQREFSDGAAMLSIFRHGRRLELAIRAVPACRAIFQVVPEKRINAEADGKYVQVSSSLVALAASRDELAALLAHELAHNMLGHKTRLDTLKVRRGLLASFGRDARHIRATETEADRLSIYVLTRSGYDPAAAIAFWTRLSGKTGSLPATHPRWSDRLRSMRREMQRITKAPMPSDKVTLPPDLALKLQQLEGHTGPCRL